MRSRRLAPGALLENPGATIVAPSSPASSPLGEGYYEENFQLVLDTVVERYNDLLLPEELAFHQNFTALPQGARRLFVRLTSRKGPSFRRDRLHYQEIPDLDDSVAQLIHAQFLDGAEDLQGSELLTLLVRTELAELVRQLVPDAFRTSARRDELLATLSEQVADADLQRATRQRLTVLRPLHQDLVLIFRLLFFGNLHQDFTEFVLRDLGLVRYEPYPMDRALRRFPERQALDDDLLLRQLRERITLLLHQGEVEEARTAALAVRDRRQEWHPQSRRHADRILVQVARQMEREGDLDMALDLYTKAELPPARERRARVLAQLGRSQEACGLCEDMHRDPRDETEAIFAPRFAHRLRRQLGESLPPWSRSQRPVVELSFPPQPGLTVEALLLKVLAERGRQGFFSENWLWKSLFGLAFWDIVFAPVAGVFQHPFQFGPLDLYTPDFRRARAPAIRERLAELRQTEDLAPRLLAIHDAKEGTANSLVSWHETARPQLEMALGRIRGPHLALVADRFSRDPGRYRRGFPDLFLLSDEEPGFELWEVKGPGDQLRAEQKAWLDYLNGEGIPARVAKVRC